MAVAIAGTSLGWLASSGIRADSAARYDAAAASALQSRNLDTAYRDAQFANALKPSHQRAIDQGSIAYLRGDYEAALNSFESIDESQRTEQANLGIAASAAALAEDEAFSKAAERLGQPSDRTILTGLAYAYMNIGDIDSLKRLTERQPSFAEQFAAVRGVGLSVDAPDRATAALEVTPGCKCADRDGALRVESGTPAFTAFVRRLIELDENAQQQLAQTIQRMAGPASKATRLVMLSEQLYQFKKYVAAERLAQQAVRETVDYRDAYNALAAAQIARNELTGAERSLNTSIDLDEGFGYTWYLRSRLAELQGETGQSQQYADQAKALGYRT